MISREEIESLAKLARIELDEDEIASLEHDMSTILDYVGQLADVSAEAAQQTVPLLHNVMRDDAPRAAGDPVAGKEAALRAAFPKERNGFNVVRKIIQKDE